MNNFNDDEDENEIELDPDRCLECQGSGQVPTMDFESYLGAMYKPCPVCHGVYFPSHPMDNPSNLSS